MISSQPWANISNFEALAVYIEIISKRLCNRYGNVLLIKNALNYLKITSFSPWLTVNHAKTMRFEGPTEKFQCPNLLETAFF